LIRFALDAAILRCHCSLRRHFSLDDADAALMLLLSLPLILIDFSHDADAASIFADYAIALRYFHLPFRCSIRFFRRHAYV